MSVSLEDIKKALRIEHNEDDTMLMAYLTTAGDYVLNAVDKSLKDVPAFIEDSRHDMAVSLLTQHWYMNRGVDGASYVPATVLSMIQQLRGEDYATDNEA